MRRTLMASLLFAVCVLGSPQIVSAADWTGCYLGANISQLVAVMDTRPILDRQSAEAQYPPRSIPVHMASSAADSWDATTGLVTGYLG
jgi:hypothetical protein